MSTYGVPHQVITSAQQISPQAIEEIAQLIEQRGLKTPLVNVTGFQQTSPKASYGTYGGSPFTTASTSYSDLSAIIENLRPGFYAVTFGGYMSISNATYEGWIALQINGVDPSLAVAPGNYGATQTVQCNTTQLSWVWNTAVVTLTDPLTTLKLRCAVTNAAATASVWRNHIISLRLGQTP